MKKFFFLILICISINSFSQKKNTNFLKVDINSITLQYQNVIDFDNNDTLWYVILTFQNRKYTSITDIKSIFLSNNEDLKKFLKDLKSAWVELDKGEKVSMSWDRSPLYSLRLYDFSKNQLYLVEGEGTSGFTSIPNKSVKELIVSLSQIEIGSDKLLEKKSFDELIKN